MLKVNYSIKRFLWNLAFLFSTTTFIFAQDDSSLFSGGLPSDAAWENIQSSDPVFNGTINLRGNTDPGGDPGMGEEIIGAPVGCGLWLMLGFAIAYGGYVLSRKSRKK